MCVLQIILYQIINIIEGRDKATIFNAKYIETSCVLKHNVDELLVGVTKQMLLRRNLDEMNSFNNPASSQQVSVGDSSN